jgi:hypothetical protein
MAWCARRRRRSFIVPLYRSQFRVSRRYVPHPDPGGALCPSRNSCRLARRPGPTALTATTRTRRRGPTCHRSVRRGRGVPRAKAIRLVPAVRSAGVRAVLAGLEFPLALAVPVVLGVPVALGAALRVLAALAAVLGVLGVLVALGAVLRVLAASAVRAVRVEGARSVPRFLSRPEDRRTARIPGV